MKNLLITITLIFALINGSKIYANNDSLTIIELQKQIKELNLQISKLEENTLNFDEDTKFSPIRFTLGLVAKGAFKDGFGLSGVAVKFSTKKWNYKHYGYIDVMNGRVDGDVRITGSSEETYCNPLVGLSLGYLYNICNYVMLGGSAQFIIDDDFFVRPELIVSITNDSFFNDLHFSAGKYGFGIGYSIGICF